MKKRVIYGCLIVILLVEMTFTTDTIKRIVFLGCFIGLALGSQNLINFTVAEPNGTTRTRLQMQWSQTFGGTDDDCAGSVIQTVDGGFALAGFTQSYGAGGDDFWLIKTDSTGTMIWNKTYGDSDGDGANSLIQTTDGGYALAGRTVPPNDLFNAFWLVKTDANGLEEWNKTFGGTHGEWDWASSLIQAADGGFVLAGTTTLYGNSDFWLVKTNATGHHEWNNTFGGSEYEWASSLIQTADGGYALVGSTSSFGAGNHDFWLVKTNATGQEEWNKTFGGTTYDGARSLLQTADGGYVLAGYTNLYGNTDFWLVKTDAMGLHEWNQTFGGRYSEQALALIQTVDGGFVLAGETISFGAGYTDFWLVKTDVMGHHEWNQTFGGASDEYLDSSRPLIQTTDGGLLLTGWTSSFGVGGYDTWLLKLNEVEITSIPTTTPQVTTPEITSSQEPESATAFPSLFSVIGCMGVLIIWRKRGKR